MKGMGTFRFLVILRVCFGMGLVGLITGCAAIPRERIASRATDYNLIVEKSQNEMFLLNVIRASKRRPMHFTKSTKLTGQMSVTFETGSINLPFGEFGTNPSAVYSLAPRVSYTTNPTIEVAVLGEKEFMKGMLTPLSLATVQDYWQQGWSKELLLNLFVLRIKTEDGETLSGSMERPYVGDGKIEFEKFQQYLRDNLSYCDLVTKKAPKKIGPKLDICHASDLEQLIALNKAELELKGLNKDEGKYQLEGTETTYYFDCSPADFYKEEFKNDHTPKKLLDKITSDIGDTEVAASSDQGLAQLKKLLKRTDLYDKMKGKLRLASNEPAKKRIEKLKANYDKSEHKEDLERINRLLLEVLYPGSTPKEKRIMVKTGSESVPELDIEPSTVADDGSGPKTDTKQPTVYVTFRAPEGILYFLGEIMRVKKAADRPMIKPCQDTDTVQLFDAHEATANDKSPFVSVDYEGIKYVIPREEPANDDTKCSANNSSHVVSLVSLLISRQVIASELPPATGVSIGIGR